MSGAKAVHGNFGTEGLRLVGVFEMKAPESAAKPMKWKQRLQSS